MKATLNFACTQNVASRPPPPLEQQDGEQRWGEHRKGCWGLEKQGGRATPTPTLLSMTPAESQEASIIRISSKAAPFQGQPFLHLVTVTTRYHKADNKKEACNINTCKLYSPSIVQSRIKPIETILKSMLDLDILLNLYLFISGFQPSFTS